MNVASEILALGQTSPIVVPCERIDARRATLPSDRCIADYLRRATRLLARLEIPRRVDLVLCVRMNMN